MKAVDKKVINIDYLNYVLRLSIESLVNLRYHTGMKKKGINPLKNYVVPTENIHKLIKENWNFGLFDIGRVTGGKWDENPRKFNEHDIFQSLKSRYEKGNHWSETKHYRKCRQRIKQGETCWHGCKSTDDLDERCKILDNIYQKIKIEGYKSQSELQGPEYFPKSIYPIPQREISVGISRDGSLILLDGRHRLGIAKILNIDKVPVAVSLIHSEWGGGLPNNISQATS